MEINADYMDMNDDLLITYLLDEATADQVVRIEQWLAEDVVHQRRLEQFRIIWETSRAMQLNTPIDAHGSLLALKLKIKQQKQIRNRNHKLMPLKMAATLLLACGIAWLYFSQFANKQIEVVSTGTVKTDTLSDGSIITLNKHSLLQYPKKFSDKQRLVSLNEGEAFFKISPNKDKPFIISSDGTTIKVVGTSFNVKNRNNGVEVIVETGIVQVSRNNSSITLKPGEKVLATGTRALLKEHNTDHLYTYYRDKEFIADNTPLWRMVEVLNEAYDSHIIIGRKDLDNQLLNTTFKNESLNDILQVISHTFKITVETKGKQIILK